MSDNQTLHGGMGATWLQPGGPNSQSYYLGCYELSDTEEPLGEVQRMRVPDPHHPGRWREVGLIQAPPDAVSTSLVGLTGRTADYLQRAARSNVCPMGLYVLWTECGHRGLFNNYDVIKVLENALPTSLGESNLAQREGVDDVMQTWAFTARKAELIYPMLACISDGLTNRNLTAVVGGSSARCVGPSGGSCTACDVLFATTNAPAGAKAEVWRSTDGGATWTMMGTPFGIDVGISAIVFFSITPYANRVMVTHPNVAGVPAEIAYSDDSGATWTVVTVLSALNCGAYWNGSLFALDMHHIWLGLNVYGVYFSQDGGATWVRQPGADPAGATLITCIHFCDDFTGLAVGVNNEMLFTTNGGTLWEPVAPAPPKAGAQAMSCWVVDRWRWFVGYLDGDFYYTDDAGATWYERVLPIPFGMTDRFLINSIMAYDEYILYIGACGILGANHYPVVYRSYDGGFTWESVVGASQGATGWGAESVWVCGANSAYAVGDMAGTLGTIIHAADTCTYGAGAVVVALCVAELKLDHECRSYYVATI